MVIVVVLEGYCCRLVRSVRGSKPPTKPSRSPVVENGWRLLSDELDGDDQACREEPVRRERGDVEVQLRRGESQPVHVPGRLNFLNNTAVSTRQGYGVYIVFERKASSRGSGLS